MGTLQIDETGKRYGRLQVMSRTENNYNNRTMWLCKCDCGNEKEILGSSLRTGRTRSCGCLLLESRKRFRDETGKRYGSLVVLKSGRKTTNNRTRIIWFCKCDCGNDVITNSASLRSGKCKQCRRCASSLPKGVSSFNALFSNIRNSARIRKHEWKLTKEQVRSLTKMPCFYCGAKPSQIYKGNKSMNGNYIYNGLDRVDSNGGYTIENIVPCCKVCNVAKNNHPQDEFKNWVTRIYNHWASQPT